MTEEKQKEPASANSASVAKATSAKEAASTDKQELNIEELKKRLEECEELKNEYLTGWQRARAELLNYKKEELGRLGEILKYADVGLILKILPILDNFEKAENEVRSMKYEDTKTEELIRGFLQIKTQFQDFLKNQGIEEIKSLGEKFDPNFMEIVEEIEVKDPSSTAELTTRQGKEPCVIGEEDKSSSSPFAEARVIEEIQKGYKLHDKILRPAKVRITK